MFYWFNQILLQNVYWWSREWLKWTDLLNNHLTIYYFNIVHAIFESVILAILLQLYWYSSTINKNLNKDQICYYLVTNQALLHTIPAGCWLRHIRLSDNVWDCQTRWHSFEFHKEEQFLSRFYAYLDDKCQLNAGT